MKTTLLLLSVLLGGCRGGHAPHVDRAAVDAARRDTVEILEAVWRTATIGHSHMRAPWLYLPNADIAALTASDSVRGALSLRGIPASTRLPAGDDTVIFRVRRWAVDPSGMPLIEVHSSWTTMLGSGPQRCRTGSGNVESYRAFRTSLGWSAERTGPVEHGDSVCRPAL